MVQCLLKVIIDFNFFQLSIIINLYSYMFFHYECDPNDGLVVLVAQQRLICQQQGDILNFSLAWKNQNNFNLYYGNLICPACEDICQDKKVCDSVREINLTNKNKTQKEMLFRLNGEEIGLNEQKNQCFRLYNTEANEK
ncbi:hypothetical protein BpHYR1_011245 [Brachionus plicatilis]|uniref:Uncharacterized protein n=1 Tax=Brachionus plicatilis TaxID=10195 RepID=A0A3M7RD46_BRAPC|nr:hypothetical protein BpHYR1_011245 [Brachionus plicatilis]